MSKLFKKMAEASAHFLDYFRRVRSDRQVRKRLLWWSGSGFIGLLIILLILTLSVSPAEISLAELKQSWEEDKICHEACSLKRKENMDLVIKDIQSDSGSRTARRIEKYFSDPGINGNFKKELVRIVGAAQGGNNPPVSFRAYLADEGEDASIRAEILSSFRPESWLVGEDPNLPPLDYYFNILNGSDELLLRRAALRALSNLPNKDQYLSSAQLDIIKGLIFDPNIEISLRRDLIMLLGDYYPLFSKETAAVLRAFYKNDLSGDNIARAFAADILNRSAGTNFKIPDISETQWAEYYEDQGPGR